MKTVFQELDALTKISGASGHEDRVVLYVADNLRKYSGDVFVDRLGNVTATFQGTVDADKSLIIFGHMDEIGLIVSKIEDDGFLRFERIGGTAEKTLRAQYVDVFAIDGTRCVPGVIGTSSHHYTKPDEKTVIPPRTDMYIDIGASCRAEVKAMGVDVGSVITYRHHLERLGETRIATKALDNRMAVCVLLRTAQYLMDHPPRVTVHLGFSVQEEFSVRGVTPVFQRLDPDYSVCIDISPACDTPDLQGLNDIVLGGGPVVTHMNTYGVGPFGGLIPNPKFRMFLEETAKEAGIPFQREAVCNLVTDAAFMQYMGDLGVVSAHLSIPVRYSHAPIETADVNDVINTAKLVNLIAEKLDGQRDFSRYK